MKLMSKVQKGSYKIDYIEDGQGAVFNMESLDKFLFIFYESGAIYVYNMETEEIVSTAHAELGEFYCRIKGGDKISLLSKEQEIIINMNGTVKINIRSQKDNLSKIEQIEKNIVYDIRILKEIDQDIFLCCGYGNEFEILKLGEKVEVLFRANHNNWVNAAYIQDKFIYTVGHDGWINKWDICQKKKIGVYPLKQGWIFSIQKRGKRLFIGTQYGEIYSFKDQEFESPEKNCGAIWNIYVNQEKIYSVSEGGELVITNRTLSEHICIKCSQGWLNALVSSTEKLYGATSRGEIVEVNEITQKYKIISKDNVWYNSLEIDNDSLYLVSAEGVLSIFSLERGCIVKKIVISAYQLIDIKIVENYIVTIDVEGHVFFINIKSMKCEKVIDFKNIHLTSFAYNPEKKIFYMSSLEGIIILLNWDYSYTQKRVTKGRIWKVDYSSQINGVAFISTSYNISIYNSELTQCLGKVKSEVLGTTCKLEASNLYVGDEKGCIHKYEVNQEQKNVDSIPVELESEVNIERLLRDNVVLFIESQTQMTDTYVVRDRTILECLGVDYIIMDISKNIEVKKYIVQRSGWSKFPQILFWGDFISSASVIAEMFEAGTLKRLIAVLEKRKIEK